MQFNSETNNQDIISDITFLTGANLASDYPIKERTRNINEAYGKVASIILQADGRWQWDDPNHTDLPISKFNLVNGQEDYTVIVPAPTALQDWLVIERVEILDANDNGILLTPFNKQEVGVAWEEFLETDDTPRYFDMAGSSIFLKPNPNYNKTSGGIITFKRNPSYFAIADTAKRPGFARLYHRYLSLSASYDWFIKIGKANKANTIKRDMAIMEQDIKNFYSKRPKYEIPQLRRAYKSYK